MEMRLEIDHYHTQVADLPPFHCLGQCAAGVPIVIAMNTTNQIHVFLRDPDAIVHIVDASEIVSSFTTLITRDVEAR